MFNIIRYQKNANQIIRYHFTKKQESFNFMATVTISLILEAKKIKSVIISTFPLIFAMKE